MLASQGGPTSLYRFYDRNDQLLYVGITVEIAARLDAHRRDKPWWREAAMVTLEHFETRADAELAERAAIKTEQPLWNIAHRQKLPTVSLPVKRVPPATRSPGRGWLGVREVAAIFRVSESTVYRSLTDEQARAERWGEEGVGWRRKPLSTRGIYQVSRQRTEELAGGGS